MNANKYFQKYRDSDTAKNDSIFLKKDKLESSNGNFSHFKTLELGVSKTQELNIYVYIRRYLEMPKSKNKLLKSKETNKLIIYST